MKKKLWLTILLTAMAFAAGAAVFDVISDTNDDAFKDDGVAFGNWRTTFRFGYDSAFLEYSVILPFQLPDIGGQTISIADLEVYAEDSAYGSALNGDLYGVRVSDTATLVFSNDFYRGVWDTSGTHGTAIQQTYIYKAYGNPAPLNARTNNCSLSGKAALAAYLQSIYDNDPAAAGKYVFLRLNLDQNYTSGVNSFIYVNSANAAASQPVLRITTGATAPTAGFTATPTNGWPGVTVTFSDVSTGEITNRYWDFGDGTTTNTALTSLQHSYAETGTYTVALTVSSSLGTNTSTQTDLITVSAATVPAASFRVSSMYGRTPLAVTFTDTSTGDVTNRLWDFGDGNTTNAMAATVGYTYAATGTYTVALTCSGPAGSSSITRTNLISVSEALPSNMVEVFSDAVDCSIGIYADGTRLLSWSGQDKINSGGANYQYGYGEMCGILVFQLPDLQGKTIGSADLSVRFEADFIQGITGITNAPDDAVLPKWTDLYAIRYASASTVSTNDYGYKEVGTDDTLIQSQFLFADGNINMEPTLASTDASGDAALASWLQAQYDAGAQPGDYVFLRSHSVFASGNSFGIFAGNSTNQPPPALLLTLTDGGQISPPPASVVSIGSLGAGQDVISWTTAQGSGYVYSVWYSTNLLAGFQPLETDLPDSVQSITNTINASPVFYKIEAK